MNLSVLHFLPMTKFKCCRRTPPELYQIKRILRCSFFKIEQLKDAIKQKKRELDDKLSVLKASEVVSTEPDKAEQISLIEQICGLNEIVFVRLFPKVYCWFLVKVDL